jgi:hypothetical protein
MSELITAGLVISKLSKAQEFASGDHVERIYGCQISLAGPKQLTIIYSPVLHLWYHRVKRDSFVIFRMYLPLMRNATSATHTPIVIRKGIFAMFQTAILPKLP